jgi:hypothetical protein
MNPAINNLTVDGLVIPPDFPVDVSCPHCAWRKEFRVFRFQWDTPEAVTMWAEMVTTDHAEARPACTVSDELNVKINVPKMDEEMRLRSRLPS